MAKTSLAGGPMSDNESMSVSVRKIDNGYVVSRSRSTGDSYECTEEYTAVKPTLAADGGGATSVGPSSMKRAVDILNGKR